MNFTGIFEIHMTEFYANAGLLSEHVTAVEWEKTQLQELDITATDLSTECLMDLLTRLTNLRWLSVGQQDGLNDSVSGNN